MMHAASIVNSLAPRHVAPSPAHAVIEGHVAPPSVAAARPAALENDRLFAERCRAAAQRAAILQQEGDLATACGRIETYYRESVGRRPGQKLPKLDNPCVDFGRVLRKYVGSGSAGSVSSA